ncbi:hypothetical protein TNCV_4953311 [Trichonephila clavipes]|nr:hypothetical protein TNCV_4953311 [Trichonephila clavipes]
MSVFRWMLWRRLEKAAGLRLCQRSREVTRVLHLSEEKPIVELGVSVEALGGGDLEFAQLGGIVTKLRRSVVKIGVRARNLRY